MNLDFSNIKIFDPTYLFEKTREFFKFITGHETVDFLSTLFVIYLIYLLGIIFYSIIRLFEIREQEHEHTKHEIKEYALHQAQREEQEKEKNISKNRDWNKILEQVFSENEGDWKLSIINADNMLDNLVSKLGFKGENLGEKLKKMNQDKFINLSSAWEVHLIRNKIAHDNLFIISQHEAKRIIALYEQIFREFDHI